MNSPDLVKLVQKPRRVRHSYTQSIHAGPDTVFPLLCPVREFEWLADWQPDWVISESGVAETGCIFQTPVDSSQRQTATWVITVHDPESRRLEMLKFIPQHTLMKLQADLVEDGQGGTKATIAYEYTALGPEGHSFLDNCTKDWYEKFMQDWQFRALVLELTGNGLKKLKKISEFQ